MNTDRHGCGKRVRCLLFAALVAPICFNSPAQLGAPINIPGRIEAENYDMNGAGVSYNDLSAGNSGGVYRSDSVDIEATSDFGGGYDVGWIEAGEWLNYTINVQETAVYQMTFRVSDWNSAGSLQVSLDGLPLCGTQTPVTGGYQNWTNIVVSNVVLHAGLRSMRLEFQSGNFNLNYIQITKQRNLTGNFLRASGKQIVNGAGENVLLRGIGLGNWMLQEPYMLDLIGVVETQTELQSKITHLVGTNNMNAFYAAWLTNYMTAADVRAIAQAGFNSIRLPMHYKLFTPPVSEEPVPGQNTWLPNGFDLVSSLANWCASNQIYLILDMHGAPGGQGHNRSISDYNPPELSLWESPANRAKIVALWREIATHYATNEWIGGYDLINEPNWTFENSGDAYGGSDQTNAPLRQLTMDITVAIREVDTNHLIVVEGNGYGNNYKGIFPPWDANMAVSFHKYWNDPSLASYQGWIGLRDQWNVPLWMGESGENSNEWFRDAIRFAEQVNIGWSWWPWKKNDNTDGTVIFNKPAGYQTILNYWRNGGAKPSTNTALNAFMELAAATRLENCSVRRDVIDALLRAGQDTTLPFTNHTAPGIVFAADYDLGRQGEAYFDTTATNNSYNNGYACRNDSVDIERVTDSLPGNGYDVGWCDAGDWLKYTVTTPAPGPYRVLARVASGTPGGSFYLETNGTNASGAIIVPGTGGWQNWTTINAGAINLQLTNSFKLVVLNSGFNVQWLTFQPLPGSTNGFPAGWTNADVGPVGLPGSAARNDNGLWIVCGSGSAVGGTADQFNFTCQDHSGDGVLIARVATTSETGASPKAGVMFRESNNANASYAFACVAGNAIVFECRSATGGVAFSVGTISGTAPRWMKLVRSGNSFSGYHSLDGVTWTLLGTRNISMASSIKAGIAITANNNSALNIATLDNVSLAATPQASPRLSGSVSNQQFVLSWPDWAISFQLYTTTNLAPPAIWKPVTNSPVAEPGLLSLTLPIEGDVRFFQLVMSR